MSNARIREYQAVFQEETDGGFSVWAPDLPGCASQGETLEEALENIKEAIELYLEDIPAIYDTTDFDYKRQFVVPVRLARA
jgi:predicted RNase H-like HicB family nuclease